MSSAFTTKIAYAGEAVDDGIMDIKALAPALLALGDTIEEANKVLNGADAKIQVSVRADFRQGSFEVAIEVLRTVPQQIQMILGQMPNFSALEICAFLGAAGGVSQFCGITLIDAIKWIAGRHVKSAKILNNGSVRLKVDDDEKEITKEVYALLQSVKTRRSLDGVLEPLKHEGVSSFQFRSEKITTIEKTEVKYFALPEQQVCEEEKELPATERTAVFKIIGVNFEEGLKWRLSDGEAKFYASILDKNFSDEVNSSNLSFAKGDMFEARMRTTQKISAAGLKVENEIIEVMKFHHRGEQGLLKFPEE